MPIIPRLLGMGSSDGIGLNFRVASLGRETAHTNTTTITGIPVTLDELCVFAVMWDNDGYSENGTSINGTSGTLIVDNFDGTEYPEGSSYYYVSTGSFSSDVTVSISGGIETSNGAMMVFTPNTPIQSIVVGNTATADGSAALNSTLSAETPATVPEGVIRLKGYFLTGRPQASATQDPTPTFVEGGWTHVNPLNTGTQYAYKILNPGDVDVDEQITTTDAGRQGHHLFSLEISF